jgi:DNA replication and repair protein RecF
VGRRFESFRGDHYIAGQYFRLLFFTLNFIELLFLRELHIENFKNLLNVRFKVDRRFIFLTGLNGAGKTNILDSIHYMSFGKSYFHKTESNNVNHECEYFNIKGALEKKGEINQVFCAYLRNQKKVIRKNDVEYDRLADLIGEFPVVIITPYDIDMINDGSEERRKFLDVILSQINAAYLEDLITYHRVLKQRNARLELMYEQGLSDEGLIGIYDRQLAELGEKLYEGRKEFLIEFTVVFKNYYSILSDDQETPALDYVSQLNENRLADLLDRGFRKDLATGRTNSGIHKDDINFSISGHPLKKFGSQGQQKSFLLALKFAQYEVIKKHKGFRPILLLDDIFDRLDEKRIFRLMSIITGDGFGQAFVTDTSSNRIRQIFSENLEEIQIIDIAEGKVIDSL